VAWWREKVTPGKGGDRKSKNQRRGPAPLISRSEAEDLSGIKHQTISKWGRRLEDAEAYKAHLYGSSYEEAMGLEPGKPRGTQGTGENEWFTPVKHLDLVRQVFGGEIDLDPASSAKAQKQVQAKLFYTKKDNGLKKEWHGNVFLNPPYAQPDIGQFVDKLLEEIAAGRAKQAILLTHNYTGSKWFRSAARAASAIYFNKTRIRFESPTGEKSDPTQWQCFFYYGDNPSAFARVFNTEGGLVFPPPLSIDARGDEVAKFDDGFTVLNKWEADEAALKWRADQSQPMFKRRKVA
jgi:phage N-6-adenine-methyltransferase